MTKQKLSVLDWLGVTVFAVAFAVAVFFSM